MQNLFDELNTSFGRNDGRLSQNSYDRIAKKYCSLFDDSQAILMLLQASGYPIEQDQDGYINKNFFTPYQEQKYCVIDIETNGSNPNKSQVIEIGAIMVQNGQIIDKLETFVECAYLPEHIIKITGIEPEDLRGAPSRRAALTMLREFMKDAVFVAHNAGFDYSFLNSSFNRFALGNIGNSKLCSIELAKRTFQSEKYGLAYLIDFLGIKTASHHRALSDAICANIVMQKSFQTIPDYVITTQDLLNFATSSKKQRTQLNSC